MMTAQLTGFLPYPYKTLDSLRSGIQKELLKALRALSTADFRTIQISLEVALSLTASREAGGEVEVFYQPPAGSQSAADPSPAASPSESSDALDGVFRDL